MGLAHIADLLASACRTVVLIGLAASVLSIPLYLAAARGAERALRGARAAMRVSAAAAVFSFAGLVWLVVERQFQFKYVFDYSAADLGFPYNFAAAWAGQEGSFLLWLFWTGIIGLLVAWKAGKWEPRVMAVFQTVPMFLFAILMWLSPYRILTPDEAMQSGMTFPPTDGMGLNPSLQNIWMAIHPPTIFFGFASLAVPFAYAVATMLWREYDTWARRVTPWVLLTVGTLGVGKMMGGYWAYQTLGWHGFWAWDPVENVSLLPWLSSIALLHGLLVQKHRGGLARGNLLLAIISWMLFIYGTFLTRSGVLANFSVHSFVSLENAALQVLVAMMAIQGLGALGLLAMRWRSVPVRTVAERALSRDAALMLAASLMSASCLIIAIGTSWPMVSRWAVLKSIGLARLYSETGGSAQPVFYNQAGTVMLIPGLLLMGAVPFLAWNQTDRDKFVARAILPWMLSVVGGFAVFWFAVSQMRAGFTADTPLVVVILIATLGLFAAFANMILLSKVGRKRMTAAGGWVAHIGFGVMFVGVVVANVYERTENLNLVQGQPPAPTSFGYAVQFAGWTDDAIANRAREARTPEAAAKARADAEASWWKSDHGVRLKLIPMRQTKSSTGVQFSLDEKNPVMVTAPVFLNRQMARSAEQGAPKTMRWPYIFQQLHRDLYLAVAGDPSRAAQAGLTLVPGETSTVSAGAPGKVYSVRYQRMYVTGEPGQPGTVFGAELAITTPDGRTVAARPGMQLGGETGATAVNSDVPELAGTVQLAGGLDPASKRITLLMDLPGVPATWQVPLAVTNKPMINLVWLGVILVGIGALLALVRRTREVGNVDDEAPSPVAAAATNGSGGGTRSNGQRGARGAKSRAAASGPSHR